MHFKERVDAVVQYQKYGTPVPGLGYGYDIGTRLIDPQELLGHAANALRTVLSPDRGGPLWQMTHHVIPYPGVEGAWFFKAYAHYMYNRDSRHLVPPSYCYLHVTCVAEWNGTNSNLALYFKDDLGWLFKPFHLLVSTVNSVTQFLQAQNLSAAVLRSDWVDFSSLP